MVSWNEKVARIKDYYKFNPEEIGGLIAATIITGIVFSFRDWGVDNFDFSVGVINFLLATAAAGLLFFVRFTSQKWYGLAEGYKVSFKPWWGGMITALILALVTNGRIPLILLGGVSIAFISKHRMGEYRYGFSYWNNGIISMWAVYSALIMAILFGLGLYFFPGSYFFSKGLVMAIMMGFLTLLPLPQLDAFNLYYAEAWIYVSAILLMVVASILLLTKTLIGLIVCIVLGLIGGLIYFMIGSQK